MEEREGEAFKTNTSSMLQFLVRHLNYIYEVGEETLLIYFWPEDTNKTSVMHAWDLNTQINNTHSTYIF